MAMNRNMTMAEKEVRDYAQRQMERAEQWENILFTEEQKEQVLEYAAMTGDDYEIRKMVRDLADAVRSSDEDKVDEILWNAREKIDSIPDRSVGMAELKGYGYTADDMFPLRQEMALELHRVGEKVYCLQSDGSHGDYASREMILEHEGLYGIEKDAWQRMQEQEDEIDFEEAGLYQPLMTDLDRDEALRMFDAGETVFLVTTYQRPIAVRERMEIERGPEHYQMEREDVERIRTLEKRMQEYPQITSLKEAQLLLGTENRYGIYQIIDGSPGREYEFMDLNFIERHGYQVKKEDYELIYSDKMLYGDTLDSLYEKFNIAHPADYTGHSLSVSDIVVLNENGNVKAYFVDSISFRELPDFLQLEPEMNQEEVAYRIGDQYFAIQMATEGYDYSFYDKEYKLMDGGILDDPDISMRQAIQNILEDEGLEQLERIPVDYDELQEKAEEVEAEILHEARSQRKRVPVISDHTEAEAGLNGMSRSEIEETVWAIAQAEIMENDLDARIQAVRVYGSRTRNGLYKEDSDVDVVIAYEGTVREDDLFSVLNEAGYKVGNMRVDMNPIRPDKTGRKGTCSTRTTHPYFLGRFLDILHMAGIKNPIQNFYAYSTKREIVNGVKNTEAFKKHYMDTISCSHPCLARYDKERNPDYPINCGYCYPCLIRKSSLLDIKDFRYWYTESASEFLKNNSNNQKANDLRAVISTLYRYKKIDDEGLKDMIRCSGKLDEESVQKFLRVYKSTMEDLIELLSEDDEIKGFIGEKCARTD